MTKTIIKILCLFSFIITIIALLLLIVWTFLRHPVVWCRNMSTHSVAECSTCDSPSSHLHNTGFWSQSFEMSFIMTPLWHHTIISPHFTLNYDSTFYVSLDWFSTSQDSQLTCSYDRFVAEGLQRVEVRSRGKYWLWARQVSVGTKIPGMFPGIQFCWLLWRNDGLFFKDVYIKRMFWLKYVELKLRIVVVSSIWNLMWGDMLCSWIA